MNVRIQLDESWRFSIAFECPSCRKWQEKPVATAYTGEEFVCDCGEDVRLTTDALYVVRQELEEIRALTQRQIELPVR